MGIPRHRIVQLKATRCLKTLWSYDQSTVSGQPRHVSSCSALDRLQQCFTGRIQRPVRHHGSNAQEHTNLQYLSPILQHTTAATHVRKGISFHLMSVLRRESSTKVTADQSRRRVNARGGSQTVWLGSAARHGSLGKAPLTHERIRIVDTYHLPLHFISSTDTLLWMGNRSCTGRRGTVKMLNTYRHAELTRRSNRVKAPLRCQAAAAALSSRFPRDAGLSAEVVVVIPCAGKPHCSCCCRCCQPHKLPLRLHNPGDAYNGCKYLVHDRRIAHDVMA